MRPMTIRSMSTTAPSTATSSGCARNSSRATTNSDPTSRPGVVKSRNALMDAAYDDQVYVDDRTIDSHIKRLRKKFKSTDDEFDMIETLYGVGYRFKEI